MIYLNSPNNSHLDGIYILCFSVDENNKIYVNGVIVNTKYLIVQNINRVIII